MAWKCTLCAFFIAFVTLKLLLRHIRTEHSTNPDFSITCGLDSCPQTYRKFKSFHRHVLREHPTMINIPCPTTHCPYSVVDEEQNPNLENDTAIGADAIQIDGAEDNNGTNLTCDSQNEMEIDEVAPDYRTQGLSFMMALKQRHKIRETAMEDIADGVNAMVGHYVDSIQKRVTQTLEDNEVHPTIVSSVTNLFDVDLPLSNLSTTHERTRFIRNNYYYVDPEWVVVGREVAQRRRRGRRHVTVQNETFAYFPMIKSLEQFVQNKYILDLIINNEEVLFNREGFFTDVSSGSIFRNNEMFAQAPSSFQIILYSDDLEVCNPLSKKAGTHKITLFYYTLANIPSRYRSRLPSIRLLAVVRRKLVNKYSINIVLSRIKEDLKQLEEGIYITSNGNQHFFKGASLCFVGDTLASNEFGGYKIGVGFSFQKCRECLAKFDQMQNNFRVESFNSRTKEQYNFQCNEIDQAETSWMRELICTNYGLNERSDCSEFPFFDVTQMIPQDIMHIIFEGAGVYEVKFALKKLTEISLITLKQLNNLIEEFDYGYKNRSSKPVPIPEKVFGNDETSLRQSASSMIVLMRLLPYFLIEKLQCAPDNDYVSFIIELCQIILICLSPVVSQETIYVLKALISNHLEKFKELFPGKNIIPKQHYLIHLPAAIERFGSLTNTWGMRFEAKHQFVKQKMMGTRNYQNVVKSIANSCAMYECTLNTYTKHPLFENDISYSKCLRTDQNNCKATIQAFFGTDVDQIISVFEVNYVVLNGLKFVKNQCEVCFGESNSMPEFGKLVSIWVSNEKQMADNNIEFVERELIYFCLQMYETVRFDEMINAYEVIDPALAQGLELVYSGNIFLPHPLHVYKGRHSKMYIHAPHDLIDLIRFKQLG